MKFRGLLFLLPIAAAHAGPIYLCKAYTGGMFWASAHCNQHNALIERIVNVPDSLPWDQKVALGEQYLRGAQAATPQSAVVAPAQPDPAVANRAECKALDARVEQLDGMARQPQSAGTQDWIRREREAARNRQYALRC
jgi:hypothetical protein